ncbi:FAD-dependent monooxygenase [Marinomonas spartinae]|uniref:FAD-dependent monooxygenase n=1 Tax=Marinomonas spartinae TaxID=1792290 RepID=UPI0018F12886|nr:FAD-dependent monooxygenase [Marinomonas spartinae]MBJ7555496.1 FAD-dependent monooxygenase [Marinomonas spartinae]
MRVLIVGAGVAGCALYRRLKPLGFTIDIIEKSATLSSEGAAICLPANAMLALDKLGLSKPVLNLAYQVDQIEYALSSGKTLASASLHTAPLNKAPFVALKRDDLMSLLRKDIAEDVQLNTWPEDIKQDNNEVLVTFQSGETKTYDLVVAADGINSSVRQMVQPNSAPLTHKVTNWRFTAKKPVVGIQPTYYVGNESAFMIYPISEDEVYCYGQIMDEDGKFASLASNKAIQEVFSEYASPVTECVNSLNEDQHIVLGQLKTVQHTEPLFNRVVLVGDALHGCPPSLQQGAGMSLEDINCLADFLEQHELHDALKQYQQKRADRVTWTVKESNKIIKLAGLGRSPIGRFIRNTIIRLKGPANVVGWRKLLTEMD